MENEYDAIVVGARCAGAPTAMLLARKGYRVLLLDRAGLPLQTVVVATGVSSTGGAKCSAWRSATARSGSAGTPATARTALLHQSTACQVRPPRRVHFEVNAAGGTIALSHPSGSRPATRSANCVAAR